uniref:non-specific serine/threonine protein kinase n=1 Tax=Nelumbo nucifera TaxID=4432 RepID=A0A822Y036_NELNU|nr:TPA_asm: hypothetical protein HUJ06_027295 [Nelumbo nucifera]
MPEIEETAGKVMPEALFGKYELGKLLGCGAFARVYHARNIRTGQSVAIKSISKHKIIKGGLVSHIKREISIMRTLRHSNIVKLYEVLATKTKIYFVMEFVKGGELFSKVAKGRLTEDLSRRYFQQLISAVAYCHSHGLLHTLCGTPAYVAPEILSKKGYDGAKVDIWSCGIILYVLTAGYLPFNDPNLMVMYRKIYKGEFRCPKWMSPDLKRLLSRLLDTNPNTRITVDEILQDRWFRKGYKEVKFQEEDLFWELKLDKDEYRSDMFLNAFDLISFSSGFDLSGLFNKSDEREEDQRFVSAESPEKIIEKLELISSKENLTVTRKKDWQAVLVGQNDNFIVAVEVYRLTDTLAVVEIKNRSRSVQSYEEIWSKKIGPELRSLIYQPETLVSGQ